MPPKRAKRSIDAKDEPKEETVAAPVSTKKAKTEDAKADVSIVSSKACQAFAKRHTELQVARRDV